MSNINKLPIEVPLVISKTRSWLWFSSSLSKSAIGMGSISTDFLRSLRFPEDIFFSEGTTPVEEDALNLFTILGEILKQAFNGKFDELAVLSIQQWKQEYKISILIVLLKKI